MRVAVVHPAHTQTLDDGSTVEAPESISAFRQGRIEDFVNPLTGETTPRDKVAEVLLAAAKEEFPDCEVKLQYLHDNGDGTSTWKDEPPVEPMPAGEQHEQVLTAEQSQEASA
jgi:hypothetical protein